MNSTWMRRVMLAGMGLALSAGLGMAQPAQGQGPARPGMPGMPGMSDMRRGGPPAMQAPQERPGMQQMAPGQRGAPGMQPGQQGPQQLRRGEGQPGPGGPLMQRPLLRRLMMQREGREGGRGMLARRPGVAGRLGGPAVRPQVKQGGRNLGLLGREREQHQAFAERERAHKMLLERHRAEALGGAQSVRRPAGPQQLAPRMEQLRQRLQGRLQERLQGQRPQPMAPGVTRPWLLGRTPPPPNVAPAPQAGPRPMMPPPQPRVKQAPAPGAPAGKVAPAPQPPKPQAQQPQPPKPRRAAPPEGKPQ